MNLQQLEYIIAVDNLKHFGKASEKCFVTQPTLSAMIQKLEDELNLKIFDRSTHPTTTTDCGKEIIEHAKKIIKETELLREKAKEVKGIISGTLKLGIIPTISPYLLPILLKDFSIKYPEFRLHIFEMHTDTIIQKLYDGELDAGILATPIQEKDITTDFLYYEPLKVYVSQTESTLISQYILPKDIDPNRTWMLEEGNCLTNQFINFCDIKHNKNENNNIQFEIGNMQTLLQMVDINNGITILPELAVRQLDETRKKQIRNFISPTPVREISLIYYKKFSKQRLNNIIKKEISEKTKEFLPITLEKDMEIVSIY